MTAISACWVHPSAKQRIEHRFRSIKLSRLREATPLTAAPAGIEVVRADFAGLNPHTALLQQAEQTKRNGGFTTTAAGTCENKCVLPGCHTPILCRVVGLRDSQSFDCTHLSNPLPTEVVDYYRQAGLLA